MNMEIDTTSNREIEILFNDGIHAYDRYSQSSLDNQRPPDPQIKKFLSLAGENLYKSFELALKEVLRENNLYDFADRVRVIDLIYKYIDKMMNDKDLPFSEDDLKNIAGNASQVSNVTKHSLSGCDIDAYQKMLPLIRSFIQYHFPDFNLKYSKAENSGTQISSFFREIHNFNDNSIDYILIVDRLDQLSEKQLETLGSIPWSLVIDFDPDSRKNGFLNVVETRLKIKKMFWNQNAPSATLFEECCTVGYWFLASGDSESPETIPDDYRDWQRKYGTYFPQILQNYHKIFSNNVYVLSFSKQSDKLSKVIDAIDASYVNKYKLFLCFSGLSNDALQGMNYSIYDITPQAILDYRQIQMQNSQTKKKNDNVWMPSLGGEYVRVSLSEFSHLELVHRDIAEQESFDLDNEKKDFYLGERKLSWFGAKQEIAVRRNEIWRQLESRLIPSAATAQAKIEIRYLPGCGATTMLLDFAYANRNKYPIVFIRHYNEQQTIRQIQSLYGQLQQHLLLIAEQESIDNDKFTSLRREILSKTISATLVRTQRYPSNREQTKIYLNNLNSSEFDDMCKKITPFATEERIRIVRTLPEKDRTPFLIALYAFEESFEGLQPLVQSVLKEMTEGQRTILLHIAIVDKYANQRMPAAFFDANLLYDGFGSDCLGGPNDLFRSLVYEEVPIGKERYYKIRHPLITEEIINQCLNNGRQNTSPNEFVENMKNELLHFIDQSKQKSAVPLDVIQNTLQNLFIIKGNEDFDDKEQKHFAPVFEDMLRRGDFASYVGIVLKHLVDSYPETLHFLGHLARYYYNLEGNYDRGIECARNALNQSEKNGHTDPVLSHIYGMGYVRRIENVYKKQILDARKYGNTDEISRIEKMIQTDTEIALDAFEKSRRTKDKLPGYYSAISHCLKMLDLMRKVYNFEDKEVNEFIASYSDSWIFSCLDTAKNLLIECERSNFSEQFQYAYLWSQFNSWFGDIQRAINLWNHYLSIAKDADKPRARRLLAYCLEKSGEKSSAISFANLKQIRDLMEENIRSGKFTSADMFSWFNTLRYDTENWEKTLDEAIVRLETWKTASNSLDAHFYLYILWCIKALEGSTVAEGKLYELVKPLKQRSTTEKINGTANQEWLCKGRGIGRLKRFYIKELNASEELQQELDVFIGRIREIKNNRSGIIRFKNMDIFFTPDNVAQHPGKEDIGQRVQFSMGFSFDGPRAYDSSISFVSGNDEAEDFNVQNNVSLQENDKNSTCSLLPEVGDEVRCEVTDVDINPDFYYVKLIDYQGQTGSLNKRPADFAHGKALFRSETVTAVIAGKYTDKKGLEHWKLHLKRNDHFNNNPFANLSI